ncbi:MAG: class I SAM-dependent methyltransferase [Gemmatimonadota bacterium]
MLVDGHPLTDGYAVVICNSCGTGFADRLPPQRVFDEYYAKLSKYSDAAGGTGSGALSWDDRRLRDTAQHIADLAPDRSLHIVDVGCASGGLLRHLAALGYGSLSGIDPAPACVAEVRSIPNVRGFLGSLLEVPPDVLPADVVLLSHVLEHVRDVPQALRTVEQLMQRDGLVYIEVPDAARYTAYLVAPFLDFNTEHINHFSERTLTTCIRRMGWRVKGSGTKEISSSASTLYPCTWVLAQVASDTVDEVERDPSLGVALAEYVEASRLALTQVSARWLQKDMAETEVAVWGTGQTTSILLAESALGGANVTMFADSSPRYLGRTFRGVPVFPPHYLVAHPTLPIVIGSLLHADAIMHDIHALGLANPIIDLRPGG